MNRMEGNCPGPATHQDGPVRRRGNSCPATHQDGPVPLKARTPGVWLHHLFRIKTALLLGITPLDAAGEVLMHRREMVKGDCSSRTRDSR